MRGQSLPQIGSKETKCPYPIMIGKENNAMNDSATFATQVANIISAVTATITSLASESTGLVAAAFALPLTGGIIGLAKRVFRRK